MDNEKQKDELSVLKSIYTDEEFSYCEENQSYHYAFKIFINLPLGYNLTYKDTRYPEESEQKVEISHLPPLSLFITLQKDYPSNSSPKFTLCSSWLCKSALVKLCKQLDQLWEENKGQEIIFQWVVFLQEELLQFLDLTKGLCMNSSYTHFKMALEKAQYTQKSTTGSSQEEVQEDDTKVDKKIKSNSTVECNNKTGVAYINTDNRAIANFPLGRNPIQVLIDYNEARNEIVFNKDFHTCKICFTDKLGEHCTKFLPCCHVFCKDCIRGYFEVRIKDGNVQTINCPEDKCTSEASPGQVKDLVNKELFTKYDSILLSTMLHTADVVYCPRRCCQYPVSIELNDPVANCPACEYAFCIYCKTLYHGIEPCKVNSVEKQQLVLDYQNASSNEKLIMEQRYGKKQLQMLTENFMSEHWINDNTKACPQCNIAIQKSDGCNKMTCWRCDTFFCWLCSTILNHKNPYSHYNNPYSPCANKLYHGLIPDEME